ncbi:MAG: hypothetical protein SGBAC_013258, partial [Bacillariaceae sp.]
MSEEFQQKFFEHVDKNQTLYIERLAEAVGIPSISSDLENHLGDINKMMDWTKAHIERLGGATNVVINPLNSDKITYPPILLGEFHVDPKKKTVCVYGHLDVQPAAKEDGWDTEPFTLVEKDGKLYGRGSTDDKGPALSWLWIVEAHQALGVDLPVNIKIMYEGMEEYGSEGLFETIRAEAKPGQFLDDVDFFCISDNYWVGKTKPCLTYGLRGLAYFQVGVKGCEQDLHSGNHGGGVHEAMTDLVRLMATLVGTDGKILVDGVMDSVKPLTPEEEALYETIDFDLDSYKDDTSTKNVSDKLLYDNKKAVLMHRWRYPTLSIHGIEGAFSGTGAKTVIPAAVKGKFSLRLVPDQDPKQIEKCVATHLETEFAKLQSPNKLEVEMIHGAPA